MDKWIIKKPKLDVESRDQHDTNYNNDPNFKRSEINEISSGLNESAASTSTQIHSQTYDSDIGTYEGKTINKDEKYKLLKNRWIPNEFYKFPISGTRKLKFQRHWLLEFPWLSYSEKLDGAFCLFCFLFCSKEVGKGSHISTKALVVTPFNRWKDAKEQFRYHTNLEYHKTASRLATIEQNRKMLSSIIETITLTGRQEIALGGHRDSGPISSELPAYNDGKFCALLRFSCSFGRQ
ncbi:Zinc finger, TTF-type [Cinara cedri]|uniref:Zinc finger, TTF-type n=1 Tax=Cinara cedri TaxID=506608 RepID=A0A5E4NTN0_9HEMI|nr:Zinc finger, TTF-type [Cinara cedri]